ncbi:uncharacterized protein LOC129217407 [Uloborus diversus]|uniref:uncharacterized protein LOC129217407 n=1 Tax=Uloborus diversus TaxID=327109 RepID=UPI00240A5700|nr:uncharacterized protein LOC129217407 [Uloborus diversus]
MMQRCRHVLIFTSCLLLAFSLESVSGQNFATETCVLAPTHVTVQPNADVTIGAVLPVHETGQGLYGCGSPNAEGVQVFEAMRWAVKVLNTKSGLISDAQGDLGGSLIPGVKLGLKVYDSCGHDALAVEHLTSLFPVLRSGPKLCDSAMKNSTLTIGVVDMSEASNQPDVSDSLRDYLIPSIGLSLTTLVPPERMAKVLMSATKDLNWKNVIVLHEDEEYSISVTKLLTQAAAMGGATCIRDIHSLPRVLAATQSNRQDLRLFRSALKAVVTGLPDGAAVLVVTKNAESATRFLQVMAEFPELVERIQWLFSWIPPPVPLSALRKHLSDKSHFYSIAPYPDNVQQFEEYWSTLIQSSTFTNLEDHWFLEYLMSKKSCKISEHVSTVYNNLPPCKDRHLPENTIDALLRTSRVIPAITSIFTLATAFHKAWESKCNNSPGICPQLRHMMRSEFVSQYLEPIEYLIAREDVDMQNTKRRVPRQSENDKLEGSKLSLVKYIYDEEKGVSYKQLLVFESQGSHLLDHGFVSLPSQCSKTDCRRCVRPRQSRFDDLQEIDREDIFDLEDSDEDIVIPLLLPLHKPGSSPLECGSTIDPEAVQNLEAALWTVDKINEDRSVLSGGKLGLSVIDTCSSPLLATQKLTTFLTKSHNNAMHSLVVVSASSPDETLAAASVLRPLNVSMISVNDLTNYLNFDEIVGLQNHLFQVPPHSEKRSEAALQVFDHLGWKFVTVVYDRSPVHSLPYRRFVKAAKVKGICIGKQVEVDSENLTDNSMDKIMQSIVEAKHQGSSAVVLFTREESTKKLLTGMGRFMEAKALHPGDIIMVGVGGWSENLELVSGVEKVSLGSIVLKEENDEVQDFSKHFHHLLPESSNRNIWYQQLWQQKEMQSSESWNDTEDKIGYAHKLSTTNTIQAIVAVAAGLASLRNELCQIDLGACSEMAQHPHLHSLAEAHILNSFSPRLGKPQRPFKFTEKGFGDTPIEVYNFRKSAGKSFTYLKVGSFSTEYTKLANIVTYTDKGEISMESIVSSCLKDCFRCQYSSTNQLVIPSSQDLYIAATVSIHETTSNPLSCGKLKPTKGFQNFEALLWALDTVNADPNILPGVDLGLVVFDVCDSREKAAMDVSNFLTGASVEKYSLPSEEHIVGFLAEGNADVVRPQLDMTMPLGIGTVAPSVVAPEYTNSRKFPYLLKMSMPSSVIISSIVNIVRYYKWKYVSVVYTERHHDSLIGIDGFEELKKQLDEQAIDVAVAEKISDNEDIAPTMDIIAHRLKIKQNSGARVVILLLSPDHVRNLLGAVQRLQHLGRSKMGDFVWIAYDSLEAFQMYPDQASGALVLRPKSNTVPGFKDYFMSLDVKNYTRNPWLREYWEQMFNCRGSTCNNGLHDNLQQVGFVQDRSVSYTINAFFTLAFGLDSLQKQLCPERKRSCPAFKDHALVRQKLFEHARRLQFTGLDGTPIKFGDDNYVEGTIDVFNFRDVGDVRAFLNIGLYDEIDGLTLNTSLAKGYNEAGELVLLQEISSICNDSDACPSRSDHSPKSIPFMAIPANQEFVIGVMIPVHQPGDNFFTCSRVIEENSFQNLFALSFALDKINSNTTILPEIQLGALVFDHCGRRQKAEEQIFSFIASDGSLPYGEAGLRSRAMVAALTFDPLVADDLSPLFESVLIPQIATPTGVTTSTETGRQRRRISRSPKESWIKNVEAKVIISLLTSFNWKYVTVLHSGSESDRTMYWNFIEMAKEEKVCVSKSLLVKPDIPIAELTDMFSVELDPAQESRVVVILLNDPELMHNTFEAAKLSGLAEDFVWVGMEPERDAEHVAKALKGVDIDLFFIRPETYEVPGFRDYYSRFNLNKHDPIPDIWFEEFWQHHFRCHLPQSTAPLNQLFAHPCTGRENLSNHPIAQDPFLYYTVQAVSTVAESLHDYLRRYCVHGDAATNLEDCGTDSRQILWREMRKFIKGPPVNCIDGDCGPLKLAVGYQIFQLRRMALHHVAQQVGLWKENVLLVEMDKVFFLSGVKRESVCKQECQKCFDQMALDPQELSIPKPALYANFRTMWGVIVSALSLLGVLLVIICAAYFLTSFQVTVGTTVLGYMILFGLLLLYAVNFAFILAPTEGTCGIRRFGLGLSYAIVFAGMLVKVMNIWRMMGYRGNQFLGESYHVTSPAALLVVAVGLVIIQIILSSAWLILIPPTTGLHEGEWRCHPATTFEDELIISLVYVMLMLAIIILFSFLTWSSIDNNKESRWIFTCCFFITLVWVAWTVLSTQILHRYRDLTISAANLICASVVMLCMYLRKVYIYNKLTKDQESKAKMHKTVSMPTVPNMYGTLTRITPSITPVTAYQTSSRLVGLSSKLADRTPPSRMALITADDGNSSDNGSASTQVQAADLYPLDMYDGGSQFQPSSLRLGGSSLVLDEATTNHSRS